MRRCDPGVVIEVTDDLVERFWSKVDSGPVDDCWEWLASKTGNGYGKMSVGWGVIGLSHRVSWAVTTGNDPGHLLVLHHCDNPGCVNPNHLFLGTRSDNSVDMHKKNRHPGNGLRGERIGLSKLRELDIPFIRKWLNDGYYQKDIAKEFGVTQSTINKINVGETWRHVR